jgi:hypothetical protein
MTEQNDERHVHANALTCQCEAVPPPACGGWLGTQPWARAVRPATGRARFRRPPPTGSSGELREPAWSQVFVGAWNFDAHLALRPAGGRSVARQAPAAVGARSPPGLRLPWSGASCLGSGGCEIRTSGGSAGGPWTVSGYHSARYAHRPELGKCLAGPRGEPGKAFAHSLRTFSDTFLTCANALRAAT